MIEHRISLSGVEREALESLVMGYNVNRVMTPIVALLNDPTGLLALAGILEALGIIDIMAWLRRNPWADGAIDDIQNGAFESYDAAMAALLAAAEAANTTAEKIDDLVTIDFHEKIWVWFKTESFRTSPFK